MQAVHEAEEQQQPQQDGIAHSAAFSNDSNSGTPARPAAREAAAQWSDDSNEPPSGAESVQQLDDEAAADIAAASSAYFQHAGSAAEMAGDAVDHLEADSASDPSDEHDVLQDPLGYFLNDDSGADAEAEAAPADTVDSALQQGSPTADDSAADWEYDSAQSSEDESVGSSDDAEFEVETFEAFLGEDCLYQPHYDGTALERSMNMVAIVRGEMIPQRDMRHATITEEGEHASKFDGCSICAPCICKCSAGK